LKNVICPKCKRKTSVKIRNDTGLRNYPLYCKLCKKITVINAKHGRIRIINEPDTEP
jgi:transcription elongation factor Elf1